ncbi:MAG TPA: hypothetical protein VL547_05885 [Dinghuibacter sp.]|uniref:HYC_CC_PP family protein n=1 Tax=Dinghuibacter sp. TaxID=2024697 RepID=UPI002BE42D85|nr:hypothetical protein [Dinghuibacter sp.]HTJ11530.1 hypothetical protein [Dinghuibacter sp.]
MGFRELIKRSATGFLALVYLMTTLGTVVSTHYCMGHVAGVRLFRAAADPCGPSAHGCCHTDVKVYKVDDVHQAGAVTVVTAPAIAATPLLLPPPPEAIEAAQPAEAVHAPPDIGKVPLYLRHRHLTI